jgi:hypothetical protein
MLSAILTAIGHRLFILAGHDIKTATMRAVFPV